ncbi:hypothetical protein BDF14DRAFT_1723498 [Spinellus fusiger]|nr:hypothetical protein BDF14DRAFT_1723498 [Spinellus fusiger]
MKKPHPSEADCWFIIGAHQAGATERQCADMSGIPKSTTHTILANFRKLGSPHASLLNMSSVMESVPCNVVCIKYK